MHKAFFIVRRSETSLSNRNMGFDNEQAWIFVLLLFIEVATQKRISRVSA
jgi:hypothetical protein